MLRQRPQAASARQRARQFRARLRRLDISRFALWQRDQGSAVAPLVRLVRLLVR
jgi:hypothetical protein